MKPVRLVELVRLEEPLRLSDIVRGGVSETGEARGTHGVLVGLRIRQTLLETCETIKTGGFR